MTTELTVSVTTVTPVRTVEVEHTLSLHEVTVSIVVFGTKSVLNRVLE